MTHLFFRTSTLARIWLAWAMVWFASAAFADNAAGKLTAEQQKTVDVGTHQANADRLWAAAMIRLK